jgi:hypothetical protein
LSFIIFVIPLIVGCFSLPFPDLIVGVLLFLRVYLILRAIVLLRDNLFEDRVIIAHSL